MHLPPPPGDRAGRGSPGLGDVAEADQEVKSLVPGQPAHGQHHRTHGHTRF